MDEKEARIRRITHLYYSNPKMQDALLKFSLNREVVPRYFEVFGKRPDALQYASDIMGLVKKGATSFHVSEEIWEDVFKINAEMSVEELSELRKSWDLILDIDSKFLDLSKLLCLLVIKALEQYGIKNYGVKYSGSRGFHIIVSGEAFPEDFEGKKMNEMFPEWPRAICEYLMYYIRPEYNKRAHDVMGSVDMIKKRTNLSEKEFVSSTCPKCNRPAKKGTLVTLKCPECNFEIKRKNVKLTKKKLVCPQNNCAGFLEVIREENYFECEYCDGASSIDKRESSGKYKAIYTKYAKSSEEFDEGISGELFGFSDLVLVSPRHLLRAPYSLHEKTALASVVLLKNEIEKFNPKDADPLKIQIREFLPKNEIDEGKRLLIAALDWKRKNVKEEEVVQKKYSSFNKNSKIEVTGVKEDMFPKPIKKLLKGLKDGKKRGLFILLTFLRSLNFSAEYINTRIREWNALNDPPLKEGYVRSQIEWHLRQKKQILPPNYNNDGFYRDLGLLDEKPKVKNPIVEVLKKARSEN